MFSGEFKRPTFKLSRPRKRPKAAVAGRLERSVFWGQTTVSRYGFLPKRSGNQETVVCPQFPDQIGKTVMTERTAVGLQPQQTAAAARWRRIAGNQFGGQMVVKIAASHGGPIEKWRRLMQKCR